MPPQKYPFQWRSGPHPKWFLLRWVRTSLSPSGIANMLVNSIILHFQLRCLTKLAKITYFMLFWSKQLKTESMSSVLENYIKPPSSPLQQFYRRQLPQECISFCSDEGSVFGVSGKMRMCELYTGYCGNAERTTVIGPHDCARDLGSYPG